MQRFPILRFGDEHLVVGIVTPPEGDPVALRAIISGAEFASGCTILLPDLRLSGSLKRQGGETTALFGLPVGDW